MPLTYNPSLSNFNKILSDQWTHAVKKNPLIKESLPEPPTISFKRPKNLRDTLVKAQVPKPRPNRPLRTKNVFLKCNHPRCGSCPYCPNSKTHTATFMKKTWHIQDPTSCLTKNCIYSITCTKCMKDNVQYIGMTSTEARKRFSRHRSNVDSLLESTPKSVVGKHFSENGHNLSNMSFQVIEKVKSGDPFVLKARESFWIQQYGGVEHLLNKEE